jgi:hypothetical protein
LCILSLEDTRAGLALESCNLVESTST